MHEAGTALDNLGVFEQAIARRGLPIGRSMLMPRAKTGFKLGLAGSEDSDQSFGYSTHA